MEKKFSWQAKDRGYSQDISYQNEKERVPTTNHPLQPSHLTKADERLSTKQKTKITKMTVVSNPLSDPLSDPLLDPLSNPHFSTDSLPVQKMEKKKVVKKEDKYLEDWKKARKDILNNFTSSANLPAITINQGENSARHVTVQEFIVDLEAKHNEIIASWNNNDRVQSLKIVIQCLKSLSDTSAIEFYPLKFILVLDVLESFVQLVGKRLEAISPDFPESVSEETQEVAKNWFFKILSIRELVPRFYLQCAFMRFDEFFKDFKTNDTFELLSATIRGMGNPILSAYSRMFFMKCVGNSDDASVENTDKSFQEISTVLSSLSEDKPKTYEKITYEDYIELFKPSVSWLVMLFLKFQTENKIMKTFKNISDEKSSIIVLECFLNLLPSTIISGNTKLIVEKALKVPQKNILQALGSAMIRCDSSVQNTLEILNDSWKTLNDFEETKEYLPCAAIWMEFVAIHFQPKEINKLLGGVIKRLQQSTDDDLYDTNEDIAAMVTRLIKRTKPGVLQLLRMQNFLPLISMFTNEERKITTAKEVFEHFLDEESMIEDQITIDVVTNISTTLANSVTALTSKDEERQVSELINHAVSKCSFLPDMQKQLSFLTEKRATFSHLDLVQVALVQQVNKMAGFSKDRDEKAFMQALAAFSYITIPSIRSSKNKMNLYLETAQICLMNGCLGQAEACLRAIINLLGQGKQKY